jgi:hypothetical protein
MQDSLARGGDGLDEKLIAFQTENSGLVRSGINFIPSHFDADRQSIAFDAIEPGLGNHGAEANEPIFIAFRQLPALAGNDRREALRSYDQIAIWMFAIKGSALLRLHKFVDERGYLPNAEQLTVRPSRRTWKQA